MIEFKGYISGNAQKRFNKKSRLLGQNLMLCGVLTFLPVIAFWAIETKNWLLLTLYCALFLIIPILACIPKSKKEQLAYTPQKIFTDGEYIVCKADKYVEYRLIKEAKQVYDFGEFYEIIFPFGKISDKFICQKDLLVKGTLEQFELLFEGKITRR